ncbi:hypothetical protein ACFL1L_04360 [Thermoplasmatota archaeon]
MKNKIISIFCLLLLLAIIPITSGISIDFEPNFEIEENPTAIFGVAFVAGFILNPTESITGRINANAVALIYYDRGIIKNDAGILTGLKKVSFRKTSLLSIYEQDSFGSARVFGLCSNFRIGF